MKNKQMKKMILALAFVMVISTALAGCGQSREVPSSSAPQSSSAASVTVPNSSENSQDVSPAEEELEDTAPVNSEENDTMPDIDNDTTASSASTPDETTEPDVSTAVPASSESQTSSPESGSLSGIDLNVQFGDGDTFTMHLYDNDTAAKIAEYVGTAAWQLPIYHYDDYDNWEVMQYYDIPSRYEIPSNPQSVTSEKAGTVYYSEPNRIVLFYQDAEVPSEYTPVGYIDYSQAFVDAVENNPVVPGWNNKLIHISNGK